MKVCFWVGLAKLHVARSILSCHLIRIVVGLLFSFMIRAQNKQEISSHTHTKWCYGTLHRGMLLTQKKKLPSFKECSNSGMKNPWGTVEHIDITSSSGNPWGVNCWRIGSYSRKVSPCVCVSLLFSLRHLLSEIGYWTLWCVIVHALLGSLRCWV